MSQRSSLYGFVNLDELNKWIQDFYGNPDVALNPIRGAQAKRAMEIQRISKALQRDEGPNQSDEVMEQASEGTCDGKNTRPALRERDVGIVEARIAALNQRLLKLILSFEELQIVQRVLLIQFDDAKVVRGYENLQELAEIKSKMEKHHMDGKGLVNALRRLDIEILRESNETLDDVGALMLDQRSKHLEKEKNDAAPAPYQPEDISMAVISYNRIKQLNGMRGTTAKMLVRLKVHLKKNVDVLQLIGILYDGRIGRDQEPE